MKDYLNKQLRNLTAEEREKMRVIIQDMFSIEYRQIKTPHDKSKPRPNCPSCNAENVYKNGFFEGVQKYKCRACSRAFMADPPEGVVHMRNATLMKDYLPYFLEGYDMKKCAKLTGICHITALQWRHRILESLEKKYKKAV